MTIEKITKGLEILNKYYEQDQRPLFGAKHNVLFASEPEKEMEQQDTETLKDLGWFNDGTFWCLNLDDEEGE